MAAPRRYPAAVDDAIWAGLIAGQDHATIRAALAAGIPDLNLEPCRIPTRTYFDHVARLKRERGIPVAPLDHSRPELELAESIRRRLLDAAHQAVERLAQAVAAGKLGKPELDAFARLGRELEETVRRAERRANLAASTNPADRAAAASPGGGRRSVAARLADLERAKGAP